MYCFLVIKIRHQLVTDVSDIMNGMQFGDYTSKKKQNDVAGYLRTENNISVFVYLVVSVL